MALLVLLCIGAGLVSIVLPEEPTSGAGYYDGDGDDAAATSEGFAGVLGFTLCGRGTLLPALTFTTLVPFLGPVSPPKPGLSHSPLLRSPPV
jgi:hypothetical protein